MLNQHDIQSFNDNGFLLVENSVTSDQLASLSNEFDQWVEQSRCHSVPFGETCDGRPRFDLEKGHTADSPALRRVSSPIELSDAYRDVVRNSGIVDAVVQLIGPNIKFHHCKINSKLPGAKTAVNFHQDFLFTPHSNDDLITALLFVNEVTAENGPLEVVPGSHKGPLHELWHDSVFTGSISEQLFEEVKSRAVNCLGGAGTTCLMHTRLLHGSAPNLSSSPRMLFITVYSAEDSIPLSPNPVPSQFEGELIRGEITNRIRCSDSEMRFPELPRGASFFTQQMNAE